MKDDENENDNDSLRPGNNFLFFHGTGRDGPEEMIIFLHSIKCGVGWIPIRIQKIWPEWFFDEFPIIYILI